MFYHDGLKQICEKHEVTDSVAKAYLESLNQHISYVREAGAKLSVPEGQLYEHDSSKFTEFEFPHYARQFFGDKSDPEGFAAAWLHHQNHNPHHWEYWIPRSGKYVNRTLPMPENFVREMIADWLGAGKAYTGSWDMTDWLNQNFDSKVELHQDTRTLAMSVLIESGYISDFNPDIGWHFKLDKPLLEDA